jgi:hypothetical protein
MNTGIKTGASAPVLELTRESECVPMYQEYDTKTIKTFVDTNINIKLPSTEKKIGESLVFFLVDESGSMSNDCGGMTRVVCAHQSIQEVIEKAPLGMSIGMDSFATDWCSVIQPTSITLNNRESIQNAVTAKRSKCVGSGTAIHANVDRKVQHFLEDPKETKGLKQIMLVVMSDGQDNSGEVPWTDIAASDGSMAKGLTKLTAKVTQLLQKRRVKMQLAFVGVSTDACWNVIKVLTHFPGLNSMGGALNQDGQFIHALLESFMHKFLKTSFTQTRLSVEVFPKGFDVRLLLSSASETDQEESKETYGARNIKSKWQSSGKSMLHLGTLVAGQDIHVGFQTRFQVLLNGGGGGGGGLGCLCMPPGNSPENGIRIKCVLEGETMPVNVGDECIFTTICQNEMIYPISTDSKFAQTNEKWLLRLNKQKMNALNLMERLNMFLNNPKHFGGSITRLLSRLVPDQKTIFEQLCSEISSTCLEIIKDRDQEFSAALGAAEPTAFVSTAFFSDLFDSPPPVEVEGQKKGYTQAYNWLIEDLRIILFYLTHPLFQDEAAAKVLQFIRPDKTYDAVQYIFERLTLTSAQSQAFYKAIFQCPLEQTPSQEKVPTKEEEGVRKKEGEEAKSFGQESPLYIAFKKEVQKKWQKLWSVHGKKPVYAYPRELLILVAIDFLRNNTSVEQQEAQRAEASANAARSRTRYLKRTRKTKDQVPTTTFGSSPTEPGEGSS